MAPPGNQAVNGESKSQPVVSEETGLLDSKKSNKGKFINILKRPSMQLKNIEYKEYEGDKREWTVEPASFGQINLLVGKNASGKTRILNVMVGLARLIAGKQQVLFETGDFKATLVTPNGKSFVYEVSMQNNLVNREYLDRKSVV